MNVDVNVQRVKDRVIGDIALVGKVRVTVGGTVFHLDLLYSLEKEVLSLELDKVQARSPDTVDKWSSLNDTQDMHRVILQLVEAMYQEGVSNV